MRRSINFYRAVFGGEFLYVGSFKDMPQGEGIPSVPDTDRNKIMHISLPISKETMLMGSDTAGDWVLQLVKGNNFAVSVSADNKEETDRIFNELSADGQAIMPMSQTFLGSLFWDAY